MAEIFGSGGMMDSLLLAKAALAWLAVALFIYYKLYWDKAKRHLPINFFYTKWRTVRHAVALGIASLGFAVGFTVELASGALGMAPDTALIVSSVSELCAFIAILWVFIQLALDDVPHFAHISETAGVQLKAMAAQKPKIQQTSSAVPATAKQLRIKLIKTKVMRKTGKKSRKKR
ncbi:MAG: hypothetical protein NTV88_04485 [Candidatus Micrarchaeota archaeon]|nr:hypothetical protein [Candidatus Micrarchaeota archaeon]